VMARTQDIASASSRRTKRQGWPYWVYWATLLFAIAATVTVLGFIAGKGAAPVQNIERSPHVLPQGTASFASPLAAELTLRRLFPYSVIPGGVQSAQELRSAVTHDSVVARHYEDFDLSRAHIIRLHRAREVYVSYRTGDRIYWTKKRLRLRKGETVITDGKHEARTRCGNRISDKPAEPVSSSEPSAKQMEAPPNGPLLPVATGLPPTSPLLPPPSWLPPVAAPPPSGPGSTIPLPTYPIVGGGSSSDPPPSTPTTPVATPEPGTLLMLLMGLATVLAASGLALMLARRRSKQ
jgi:hypothetical protein